MATPGDGLDDIRHRLDHVRAPLADVERWLTSPRPATVHAAVLHLGERLQAAAEPLSPLIAALPADLGALPAESQIALAERAIAGAPIAVPTAAPDAPIEVRLAWLRAALVRDPGAVASHESTALGRAALAGLPLTPVVTGGLLAALVGSPVASSQRLAVTYLDAAIGHGLVTAATAERWLGQLAASRHPAVAIAALQLLAQPWAWAAAPAGTRRLPCPAPVASDEPAVRLAHVGLQRARCDADGLRRRLTAPGATDDDRVVIGAALVALAAVGTGADLALIVDHLRAAPELLAASALEALVVLKRRGLSMDVDQARAVLALYRAGAQLPPRPVAEVVSSRGEIVLAAIDGWLADDPDWSSLVELLAALATSNAVARLVRIVDSEGERGGWWHAIAALGRLEIRSAEAAILRRLDAEPEACLDALLRIGGEATVTALRARLDGAAAAPWLDRAASVLLQLAPSSATFEWLAGAGLLTAAVIARLPAHGGPAQSPVLTAIAATAGHPLRRDAIEALGRTGGPLAIEPLAALLTDHDEAVRAAAVAALRELGPRLRATSAAPASSHGHADVGDATLAAALIDRLRDRQLDAASLIALLDGLAGRNHVDLVAVVRPLLRHRDPEVRARAVAALPAAGDSCTPWLVARLGDDDAVVQRQALIGLGAARARSAAEPIAALLRHGTMNLKKTAAEALISAGDPMVIPDLVGWLASHDNPGFRDALGRALEAIAGRWFTGLVVAALDAGPAPAAVSHLIAALDGHLGAGEVAALLARGARAATGAPAGPGPGWWIDELLAELYAGRVALADGTLARLDAELTRAGHGDRIPALVAGDADGAERAGRLLVLALREPRPDPATIAALLPIAAAMVPPLSLAAAHAHALLDAVAGLDDAAATAAVALVATSADPLLRFRAADHVARLAPDRRPPALAGATAARWTEDDARWWLSAAPPAIRDAAARALSIAGATVAADRCPIALLPELLAPAIASGDLDACRALAGGEPRRLQIVVTELATALGPTAAASAARRWLGQSAALDEAVMAGLTRADAGWDRARLELLLTAPMAAEVRDDQLATLAPRQPEAAARVATSLRRMTSTVRARAVHGLLAATGRRHRRLVIGAFLDGELGASLAISPGHDDVGALVDALASPDVYRRLRAIHLVAGLSDARRERILFATWRGDRDRQVVERCRDALRQSPVARVLPLVEAALDTGDWSVLDVVASGGELPRSLVDRFRRSPAAVAVWGAFAVRGGGGPIHGPGLAEAVVAALDGDHAAIALAVLARLSDWHDNRQARALIGALTPVLRGPDRESVLAAVVAGVAGAPVATRLGVLSSVGRRSDRGLVAALATAVLEHPAADGWLSSELRAAVDAHLAAELDSRAAERVRRILDHRIDTARTPAERAAVGDVLTAAIEHRSPRVRLHALRLLRQIGDRERYLAASHGLFADRDAGIVRSAVRISSFGGDASASAALVDLLFHDDPAVRDEARSGLLRLGPAAASALRRAERQARPDRRPVIAAVIEELDAAPGA